MIATKYLVFRGQDTSALEHRISFPDPGAGAEKNLKTAATLLLGDECNRKQIACGRQDCASRGASGSYVARVARDLSGADKSEQIVAVCKETIAPLLEAKVALILPDSTDRLLPSKEGEFADLSVAQWAYDHGQRAGLGTSILSAAEALYLPLKAPIRCRGVLAIQPQNRTSLGRPDDKRLLEACCSSIALALERIHFAVVAQEALVRMEGERMRNSLLSAVSHDLRTPLTAIRGLAETLEQATDLPQNERTEVASAIRHQAEELQQLVTNLLDLARMQSAGVRLDKQWHPLDEIVGSALYRLGPALSKREVRTDEPTRPRHIITELQVGYRLASLSDGP